MIHAKHLAAALAAMLSTCSLAANLDLMMMEGVTIIAAGELKKYDCPSSYSYDECMAWPRNAYIFKDESICLLSDISWKADCEYGCEAAIGVSKAGVDRLFVFSGIGVTMSDFKKVKCAS